MRAYYSLVALWLAAPAAALSPSRVVLRARPATAVRAGFGKAGGASGSAPPKAKLTPKKQWDR